MTQALPTRAELEHRIRQARAAQILLEDLTPVELHEGSAEIAQARAHVEILDDILKLPQPRTEQ